MNETTNEPVATEAAAPQTTPTQDQVEAQEAPNDPKMFDESYVKALRDEAASWRTKTREYEAKLKDAKTIEEVNQITAEYGQQLHAKDVEIVAIKHNIPEALRDRLRGETPEELEKDALAIAELLKGSQPAPQPTPRPRSGQPAGGLDPTVQDALPLNDPAKMAARISRRRNMI